MCGVTGLWIHDGPAPTESSLQLMRDALRHRGPDAAGTWLDPRAKLGLGHRRLSILDLSEAGAQPMVSHSGRYVLSYNGEIYNARALGQRLEAEAGARFVGHSDTEVALAAIERYGVVEATERFVGMFAFALWDRELRRLHLGRDRLGIKPLYLARLSSGGASGWAFGSELSAIERAPGFEGRVDRDVLALYFRYACVPRGLCIYEGVRQLAPGTVLTLEGPDAEPTEQVFWSAREVAQRGLREPLSLEREAAVDRLSETLSEAVRDRMVADVPLGVFLSGGIDSSAVTALMCEASGDPGAVRTFSIGFEDASYDEGGDAARVARHLGTDHTALTLTPEHAMRRVRELGAIYAEPFADSSQLPTLLVSELAREHVTVALSGDGGDELFGGYNRHLWGPRVWGLASRTPAAARALAARGLRLLSPAAWDEVAKASRLPLRTPGDKAHKLAGLLELEGLDALYLGLTSIWPEPHRLVRGSRPLDSESPRLEGASVAEEMMLRDLVGYLPDDILTKVDRASMAVSLEVRVPLLDHRVVELAWRLPSEHKAHRGVGKRVLRDLLARHVPRALFERPKMGFGVPIDAWLRGPLRGWACELLDPTAIRAQGYLDPALVERAWRDHLDGRGAGQHRLWAVLMFQSWLAARRVAA